MSWDGRIRADARSLPLADESVHTVITSPPYWGLRDYGIPGQMGLEATPEEYVAGLVDVFREIRRVLRTDGTLWVNLGDSYATGGGKVGICPGGGEQGARWRGDIDRVRDEKREYRDDAKGRGTPNRAATSGDPETDYHYYGPAQQPNRLPIPGLKPKDLVGIPWRVAFALQADGWYLRSDIIWAKPNPMPESVTDRPTRSHEYLFLLSKSRHYFYDAEAIAEPQEEGERRRRLLEQRCGLDSIYALRRDNDAGQVRQGNHGAARSVATRQALAVKGTRNRRTVWFVATRGFKGAHYATFPPKLIEPCILAGTSAAGCCAKCGAALIRVLAKPETTEGRGSGNKERKYRGEHGGNPNHDSHLGFGVPWSPTVTRTLGWKRSCNCVATPPSPCTVLDPFAGSNTTGMVAERFNRRWIACDLGYQQLQAERLNNVQKELVLE